MKYRLYTTSQKAWGGMFKAMSKAEKSIYLEMYIFASDTGRTHDFFKLLKDKVKSGVEVVIIADAYGSLALKSEEVKSLRESGIEFIFFSHWLKRTHRKIVIIDNKIAFLGGVNIKENSRNWRDVQIRLQGAIIRPILRSFANSYKKSGGKRQSILRFSFTPFPKKIKSFIIDNILGTKNPYYLNHYYRDKIKNAKKSIQIVTPYFLPPRWLIVLLDDACRRQINVEIIIPQDTDVKSLNKVNFLNYCRLSAIGVKFYLGKTMNHAKLMLIDDKEVMIGSQNLDILSFGLNFEASILSSQKTLVNDVKTIIEKWKVEAEPFLEKNIKVKMTDKIMIFLFRLFYPIF